MAAETSPHLLITQPPRFCGTESSPSSLSRSGDKCLVLTSRDACTGAPGRHLSEFSAQTSTAFLPPRTVLSATPDRASPVPAHPTHSGSANPRHHTARRGLPRPSRHQVGSQHTGSLGGDECRDLPFYSRITTRTLTQLPIFPADDRCQGRTEQRLGLHCLPRTQEQGPNLPG